MSALLHTPETWVILSLVLFFALLARFGAFRMAAAYLDGHIGRIRTRIETAQKLCEEAEEELQKCEQRRNDAEQQRKLALAQAQDAAKGAAAAALESFAAAQERRTAAAGERIVQAEAAARQEIRNQAIRIAVAAAAEAVDAHLDGAARDALVRHGIERVCARVRAPA